MGVTVKKCHRIMSGIIPVQKTSDESDKGRNRLRHPLKIEHTILLDILSTQRYLHSHQVCYRSTTVLHASCVFVHQVLYLMRFMSFHVHRSLEACYNLECCICISKIPLHKICPILKLIKIRNDHT